VNDDVEPSGLSPVFRHEFTVPPDAIDENGHVNNVAYVQWMQDIAIQHADTTGGTRLVREAGALWVVRRHTIEYLRPAFAGDRILAMTWISSYRRALTLRKYRFVRIFDDMLIARGETDWVFVDARTGQPRIIPPEVKNAFGAVSPDQDPDSRNSLISR
jgi:acyl-CoA thioester hydrolase